MFRTAEEVVATDLITIAVIITDIKIKELQEIAALFILSLFR